MTCFVHFVHKSVQRVLHGSCVITRKTKVPQKRKKKVGHYSIFYFKGKVSQNISFQSPSVHVRPEEPMRAKPFAFRGKVLMRTEEQRTCSQQGKWDWPDWRCSWRDRFYCQQPGRNLWDRHICVPHQGTADINGYNRHLRSGTGAWALERRTDGHSSVQTLWYSFFLITSKKKVQTTGWNGKHTNSCARWTAYLQAGAVSGRP